MMETPVQKKQNEFFDELLESIQPINDEFIKRRIHHINFARMICWLCVESRKRNVFVPEDLRKFIRLDASSIHRILKGLIEAGTLIKNYDASARTSYTFVRDDRRVPVIQEYFDEALKTLGKKTKKNITLSIEQETEDDGYF